MPIKINRYQRLADRSARDPKLKAAMLNALAQTDPAAATRLADRDARILYDPKTGYRAKEEKTW